MKDNCEFMSKYTCKKEGGFNNYKLIEIEISAEAFLYKLIRRLVAVFVSAAKHEIDLKTIKNMLLCPPDYYDDLSIKTLHSNGLFLKNVKYDETYFEYNNNDYDLYFNKFDLNNDDNVADEDNV